MVEKKQNAYIFIPSCNVCGHDLQQLVAVHFFLVSAPLSSSFPSFAPPPPPLFIFKSCWWVFPNDSLFHYGKACRIIRYHLVEFYTFFSSLVFQSIFLLLCINTVYISLVWQFLFIYLYCSHFLSRINIYLFQLQQITHIKCPLEAPGQEGSIRGQ